MGRPESVVKALLRSAEETDLVLVSDILQNAKIEARKMAHGVLAKSGARGETN